MNLSFPGIYSSVQQNQDNETSIHGVDETPTVVDKVKTSPSVPIGKQVDIDSASKPAFNESISNPERGPTKPISKPQAQAKFTKIPRVLNNKIPAGSPLKLAYKRNTGLRDNDNYPYTNLEDVELLNKIGFTVDPNQYLFLAVGDAREDTYSYIEKTAGVSKSVVEAIDKDQAFSAEYLKELDYKLPDGYEVKGDLVAPIEKKAAADHQLKSTNIKAVGYDKKEKTLEVEFHSGGTYKYNDVPKSLFDRIKRVKSPGKFFHKHIRKENKFEYNKLNKEE